MLDDTQIDKLADDLIAQVDFPVWLATFEWDRQALQPAWASRRTLQDGGFADAPEYFAERVHRWGFGTGVRASVRGHVAFAPSLRTLCQTWSAPGDPWHRPAAIDSLVALLDIKYCGIARVSKYVCFLDQDRFAIYDSRVSYALKGLTLDGKRRVFPFVGGRAVKNAQYVPADAVTGKPPRMAAVYVGFLRLLQGVADRLNARGGMTDPALRRAVGPDWTPALLEMALFMAGQDRRRGANILPLDPRF